MGCRCLSERRTPYHRQDVRPSADRIGAAVEHTYNPGRLDDSEAVLAIGVKGLFVAIGGDRRAKTTIDVFGLNRRRRLADARRVWISMLLEAVDAAADRDQLLQVFAAPKHPYAAIARAMRRDPAAFGL